MIATLIAPFAQGNGVFLFMDSDIKIGFPQGILGDKPLRLDVLASGKSYVALAKPPMMCLESDPALEESQTTIANAIKMQAGKPELLRLGIEGAVSAVYPLDMQASGVGLFATNKDSANELKNSFGSYMFEFEFTILSERPYGAVEKSINLPILKHQEKPRAIVSHRFGKKCSTSFELKEDLGDWQIWSAKTNFLRWHQIRLHAAEAGLRLVGDDTYVRVRKIYLSNLKRGIFKGEEVKPLYDNMAYHLSKVSFPTSEGKVEVSCPLPKGFEALIKRIRNS